MPLHDELRDMARRVCTDVTQWAVPVTLIDQNNDEYEVWGLPNDIGVVLDPDTGLPVAARQITLVISYDQLPEGARPSHEQNADTRPWRVRFIRPGQTETKTYMVRGTDPDEVAALLTLTLTPYHTPEP